MIEYYRFYEVETLMTQGKLQEAIAELRSLQKLYLELSQDNSKLKVQLHDLEEILCISQNIIFEDHRCSSDSFLVREGNSEICTDRKGI